MKFYSTGYWSKAIRLGMLAKSERFPYFVCWREPVRRRSEGGGEVRVERCSSTSSKQVVSARMSSAARIAGVTACSRGRGGSTTGLTAFDEGDLTHTFVGIIITYDSPRDDSNTWTRERLIDTLMIESIRNSSASWVTSTIERMIRVPCPPEIYPMIAWMAYGDELVSRDGWSSENVYNNAVVMAKDIVMPNLIERFNELR